MSNAVTIAGSTYTVSGTVKKENKGVFGLHVEVHDKDPLIDDFLGLGITDESGVFSVSFEASKFGALFIDRKPDLYFVVIDYGEVLLDTKEDYIPDATEDTPPINLEITKLNERTRKLINNTRADGWVGGFNPDIADLKIADNLINIDKLQRQQKVVWPEFSWHSEPDEKEEKEKKRCFQMFAPDISRLGYTNEGQVYSVICPQQGYATKNFGSLNVEVTVTGTKGKTNESEDEKERTIDVEMGVVGKIWFAPSSDEHLIVRLLARLFKRYDIKFPGSKENAIVVETFKPGTNRKEKNFPLKEGITKDFEIPAFAKHEAMSWNVANLGVEIGGIRSTGEPLIDDFNKLVLRIFNAAGGNMLKEGNTLYWNVWFTAPETVDTDEWEDHAEKWRTSIQADHGAPNGQGTKARYADGTPFRPIRNLVIRELPRIIAFIAKHLGKKEAERFTKDVGEIKKEEEA